MNYSKRIERLMTYVGQHLDEALSLDELAKQACISKYHLHRVFKSFTGISLHHYMKWLRLKRAAAQLYVEKERNIIDIAIDAGFGSHEAFSRAFKYSCSMSPSAFRRHGDMSMWRQPPYRLPIQRITTMQATIKPFSAMRLAAVKFCGDYEKSGESLHQLMTWIKAQPIDLGPRGGESFGFAYDDPAVAAPGEFHFDFAVKVPDNFKLSGDVSEQWLPKGRYAVASHKGAHAEIAQTVYWLYREWLPTSGEELGDLPCIFCYHNFDFEVPESELVTECRLLLKG